MSDGKHHAHMLRERAEYMRKAGHIDDADLDIECADEIERLTAERDAARAKLAQYEQAPVVGWLADDGRISSDETKRTAMAQPSRDAFHIPLIARPEATHDST